MSSFAYGWQQSVYSGHIYFGAHSRICGDIVKIPMCSSSST